MAESIRLQCLNKILDIAAATEGVGDTGGVKRDVLSIQRFPAVFIQPGDDLIEKNVGDLITRRLNVEIYMICRTQGNVLEAQETFLPQLDKQLASDYRLGGLCIDFSQPEGRGWRGPFPFTEGQPETMLIGDYICIYRVRRDDPYLMA